MAKPFQVRGALLEEAILYLLVRSGYSLILEAGTDPTLCASSAGLCVRGRGGVHQIDGVADFRVPQPFSNPQRLLVEAKAHDPTYAVGLPVVRNAVGVVKDVSEFWNSAAGLARHPAGHRYHYQYAVFSATRFTADAQAYAFAQDIYLIPLRESSYFAPVLRALYAGTQILPPDLPKESISAMRRAFRSAWQEGVTGLAAPYDETLMPLLLACEHVGCALVAMIAGQFPVLLVPQNPQVIATLEEVEMVRIHWSQDGWYLGRGNDDRLFSFGLPGALFERYAESGRLSPTQALNLKEEWLSEITALDVTAERVRPIRFVLDRNWLEGVRARTRAEAREVADHVE